MVRRSLIDAATVLINIIKWLLYGLFCFLINPLSTHRALWRHLTLAACYHLPQFILLAERVGQGEVCGYTALADSAWWLLQLAVEKSWSAPGEPLVWFNAPLTYKGLHFCHF